MRFETKTCWPSRRSVSRLAMPFIRPWTAEKGPRPAFPAVGAVSGRQIGPCRTQLAAAEQRPDGTGIRQAYKGTHIGVVNGTGRAAARPYRANPYYGIAVRRRDARRSPVLPVAPLSTRSQATHGTDGSAPTTGCGPAFVDDDGRRRAGLTGRSARQADTMWLTRCLHDDRVRRQHCPGSLQGGAAIANDRTRQA